MEEHAPSDFSQQSSRRPRRRHDISTVGSRLFDVATEIRALAYLFETQGIKAADISEEDMDEIGHGLGRMLHRFARQIRRIGRDTDGAVSRIVPHR